MHYEALFNLRDLGGHPVEAGGSTRHGVLFRADGVHRATPPDRERLEGMDIRVVVDLRTAGERAEEGVFVGAGSVTVLHAPVLERVWGRDEAPDWARGAVDGVAMLTALNRWLLSERAAAIGEAFTALARADGPALFHCTAGKDRTGLLAALVLDCCGVEVDAIVADYEMSAGAMPALGDWYARHRPEAAIRRADRSGDGGSTEEAARAVAVRAADPSTMHDTLGFIRRRWGSSRGLLASAGVDGADVDRLIRRLTAPG